MFTIREGIKEDCLSIEAMIKELAVILKIPNGPKIDYKQLEIDGFNDDYNKRKFYTFVAQLNTTKQLIGYVLYFYKYSTWSGRCVWMEDIYVKPQYRRIGVGFKLWQSVAKRAFKESCARLEFNVLDWSSDSIQFYQKFGAINLTQTEGWNTFRLNTKQIKLLAQFENQSSMD
jgi:diamine N-acetyltransferase